MIKSVKIINIKLAIIGLIGAGININTIFNILIVKTVRNLAIKNNCFFMLY